MQQTLFNETQASNQPKRIFAKKIVAKMVKDSEVTWVDTRYTSPKQIFEAFKDDLQSEGKEHFIALHVDGKNRLLCLDRVSVGSLNQTIVHPREVFKTACISNAAAIILIHNHPSGDPQPSLEDKEITKRLCEAGDILGIRVLDHIIIGDSYISFAESGLI